MGYAPPGPSGTNNPKLLVKCFPFPAKKKLRKKPNMWVEALDINRLKLYNVENER